MEGQLAKITATLDNMEKKHMRNNKLFQTWSHEMNILIGYCTFHKNMQFEKSQI